MLLGACGVESSPAASTTTGPTTSATSAPVVSTTLPLLERIASERVLAAADALIAQLGVEDAAAAVVSALDSGYSFNQLMDAAGADAIHADGTVAGVDPERTAYGLMATGGPQAGSNARDRAVLGVPAMLRAPTVAADEQEPMTPSDFLEKINQKAEPFLTSLERTPEAEGRFLVTMILHLTMMGYSFEQVFDAIRLGEIALLKPERSEADQPCFGLIGWGTARGKVSPMPIFPADPPGTGLTPACKDLATELGKGDDAFVRVTFGDPDDPDTWISALGTTTTTTTSTTTTEPKVDAFPWRYEGTVERVQTWTADFGERGSNTAVNEDYVELTIYEDGTTEGSYTRGGEGSIFECEDRDKAGRIYPGSGEAEVFPISWTHREWELIRADGAVIGSFDAEALYLDLMSYTNTISPSGCFNGTFILEETYVDAIVPRVSAGE